MKGLIMRSLNHILVLSLVWLCFAGFSARVDAASLAKAAHQSENQAPEVRPEGPLSVQVCKITLAPFYSLQSKGSKAWIERILVTLTMAAPNNGHKQEFDNPTFRKIFYELLQSGESEAIIQAHVVNQLKRQVRTKLDPALQISRSILIVH